MFISNNTKLVHDSYNSLPNIELEIRGANGKSKTIEIVGGLTLNHDTLTKNLLLDDIDISILTNVTEIKTCWQVYKTSWTWFWFVTDFQMGSAKEGEGNTGDSVTWIESCDCPTSYSGKSCESCIDGFYHEAEGGPFAKCEPFDDLSIRNTCQAYIGGKT